MLPPIGTPGVDLPVRAGLPSLIETLERTGTAILSAPPGSGKTSLLPLALADAVAGRVIVAEPRRIATRAAARRMAQLLGEQAGERVGYAMRGDRRVSVTTRIEVVTTGLLLRRLQRDPELAGVDAVIIDEVHERALDTDLVLAFSVDIRANLRPDLWVVATSATADTTGLAALLGSAGVPAPIVVAAGTLHPVATIFAPPPRPLPLLPDARVDPRLLDHVAAVVRRAMDDGPGDVLVFLPGEAEIAAVALRLGALGNVLRLYGRQSAGEQDRVLQPSTACRVSPWWSTPACPGSRGWTSDVASGRSPPRRSRDRPRPNGPDAPGGRGPDAPTAAGPRRTTPTWPTGRFRRSKRPTSPASRSPSQTGDIPAASVWPCWTTRRPRRWPPQRWSWKGSTRWTATGGSPRVADCWPRWPLPRVSRGPCWTAAGSSVGPGPRRSSP